MPVDKPTPGNLIQTVAELVDSVNGGGGGTDLSNYSGDTIRLTATSADVGMEIRTTPEFSALTISTQGDSSALTVFAGGTGSILDIIGDGAVGITSISSINMAANGVSGHIQAVAKDHILFGVNEASSLELLGNGNITIDSSAGITLTSGSSEVIVSPLTVDMHAAGASSSVRMISDNGNAVVAAEGNNGQVLILGSGTGGAVHINANGIGGVFDVTSESAQISSTTLGFYSVTPVTQPNGLTAGAVLEAVGLAINVDPRSDMVLFNSSNPGQIGGVITFDSQDYVDGSDFSWNIGSPESITVATAGMVTIMGKVVGTSAAMSGVVFVDPQGFQTHDIPQIYFPAVWTGANLIAGFCWRGWLDAGRVLKINAVGYDTVDDARIYFSKN